MIGTVLAVGAVLPPTPDTEGPVATARAVAEVRPQWFVASDYLTGRGHRHVPRAAQLALAAARRLPESEHEPERHGLWIGSATAGPAIHDVLLDASREEGVDGIGPLGAPYFSVNLTGSRVAAELRTLAGSVMCTTPGVAGADAIAGALQALGRGTIVEATVCLVEVPDGDPADDDVTCGAVALRLGPGGTPSSEGLRVRRGFVPDPDAAVFAVLAELSTKARPGTATVLSLPTGTPVATATIPLSGVEIVQSDSGLPAWAALAAAVSAQEPVTVGVVSRAGHWAVVNFIPHDPEGAEHMDTAIEGTLAPATAQGLPAPSSQAQSAVVTSAAAQTVVTRSSLAHVDAPTPVDTSADALTHTAEVLGGLGFRAPRDGEWAVVLGASSGFGRAIAERLAGIGYKIYGVYFGTATQEAAAAEVEARLTELGVEFRMQNANAASARTRDLVIGELRALSGRVRTVVHSLAFGSMLPFAAPIGPEATTAGADGSTEAAPLLSERQMTSTLEVMAHSLVWWVRDLNLAGLFVDGAQVWAMTSAGDSKVADSYGAVSAAKSALLSHVRQLAVELAPHGVAVNAIRAGVTMTPSFERIPGSEIIADRTMRLNPHGRLTTPKDVADIVAVATLIDSTWITGTVLGVDGGEGLVT